MTGMVARVGRFAFRHHWWVLLGWVLAAVVGALASGPVFARMVSDNIPTQLESVKAANVLASEADLGGQVIGLLDQVDPRSAAVRTAVADGAADISRVSGVRGVQTPYGDPRVGSQLVARDGRGLIVVVQLGQLDRAAEDTAVAAVHDRLDRIAARLPGSRMRVGGNLMINRDARTLVRQDLGRAEVLSLPLTAVVLVFVFGGVIAAGLPVFAALATIAGSFVVLLGFSMVVDLDSNVISVVTLLGLGLSIDYGLLLVARYREELAAGRDRPAAVAAAWGTAGRTIMFSALTVAAALSGLLMFQISALRALGAAGISAALMALLAALTLTAALLGAFGRRVHPSRRELRRMAAGGADAETGFFARLARATQRRPLVVALVTAGVLLAAGTPLLTATIKLPRLEQLPRSLPSVQVADELVSRFGRQTRPAVTVLARTDPATLDAWATRWRTDPAVTAVDPASAAGPRLSQLAIEVKGDPQGPQAQALVGRIRADRPPGTQSWVAGDAALLADLLGVLRAGIPWAVAVTVLAMFVLLFAMTGSVVVPAKAVAMNIVSLGAAFGVLVAVFEHGWLAGPLHSLTTGGLDPFIVVITFAFAFGLSMDYEVFLLSRIKEYVDAGLDTDTAVRRGLQRSGRIITSAALLMVVVFGCFAAARSGQIQEIGLGLFVAVLVDATIVRCVLVPATMTLLGKWNWWAPGPLRRLHDRFGLREHVPPADEPQPAVRA